jgi:hypothetical protein
MMALVRNEIPEHGNDPRLEVLDGAAGRHAALEQRGDCVGGGAQMFLQRVLGRAVFRIELREGLREIFGTDLEPGQSHVVQMCELPRDVAAASRRERAAHAFG